jgi:quinohemoprotein ethanol dehydrogenase
LKVESGEYAWHFQTTPGETWDFTATQPMMLADLEIGGKAAPGDHAGAEERFFYVLDRTNGEFISAVRTRS